MMRILQIAAAVAALALSASTLRTMAASPSAAPLKGFNVVAASGDPFGSAAADAALDAARRTGATAVAVVPFLWQKSPSDPDITRGTDMSDQELRRAIRAAKARGFTVIVKPHVWVPRSWAGAIALTSDSDWRRWFDLYTHALVHIAHIAGEEKAAILAIGTELSETSQRPEWASVIAALRAAFPGRLTYVAHNLEEAERVPFWNTLDLIGVSLYPPLGADADRAQRRAIMQATAERLAKLADHFGKPVLVAEIGLRSAAGAAARPWESAEERRAAPDPQLQADVLADWLAALDHPSIDGILVWRWFTDPNAGGVSDTDFTVQGKPAEVMLRCTWTAACSAR